MITNNIPELQLRRQKLRLDFLCSLNNHELAIDPSLFYIRPVYKTHVASPHKIANTVSCED